MTTFRTAATLVAILTTAGCSVEKAEVQGAAQIHYPGAKWRESSVLKGDFSCQGKSEVAILGTSDRFMVVAIFTNGLAFKPQILEYSATARDPKAAVLTKWSLDLKSEELDGMPEGFMPSKTCVGLDLSDGKVNSGLIYWNTKHGRFEDLAVTVTSPSSRP